VPPLHKKFSTLLFTLPFLFGFIKSLHAQQNIDDVLKKYNNHSVPYISVETLKMKKDDYVLFDTRKKEEYNVSHIPGAIWVGERVNDNLLNSIQLKKSQSIVVYCTVGVRSEAYGNQMINRGFTHINNLYGSILPGKMPVLRYLISAERKPKKYMFIQKSGESISKTGRKYIKFPNFEVSKQTVL
jgi:rhodanese-related sulfurtransferase